MIVVSKGAIVTGGTKGIGLGIAQALNAQGYQVTITCSSLMSEAKKKALYEKFANSAQVLIIQADVKDYEACQMVVAKTLELCADIDILVNNAGITKDNLLLKMDSEDFQSVIDTNLVGAFKMTKALSKKMIRQKYGRIINISSVIGEIGNIGQANYAASKAGLIGMSKSFAKELASRNITVNCIAPGFIETDMTAVLDETVVEKMKKQIPVQRLGQVVDVVNATMFLVNEKSSYITGQVINVCGGMVM